MSSSSSRAVSMTISMLGVELVDLAAHIEPVDVGETEIEDDKIGSSAGGLARLPRDRFVPSGGVRVALESA